MFEESPEAFISHWRSHAADVNVFSRVEGDPLLEFAVAGVILHALERTGPYLAAPGPARIIINPVTETVELLKGETERIEVTGTSRGRISGRVTHRDDPFLVVEAGAPLVVAVLGSLPAEIREGSHVTFEIQPPVHAFVLPRQRNQQQEQSGRNSDDQH